MKPAEKKHPAGEKPSPANQNEKKKPHGKKTEKEIDETIADSFPASDPPGAY